MWIPFRSVELNWVKMTTINRSIRLSSFFFFFFPFNNNCVQTVRFYSNKAVSTIQDCNPNRTQVSMNIKCAQYNQVYGKSFQDTIVELKKRAENCPVNNFFHICRVQLLRHAQNKDSCKEKKSTLFKKSIGQKNSNDYDNSQLYPTL